ncbi:hypothetical protein BH11MYX4_BH11MYX4_68100 [soil metagenome]
MMRRPALRLASRPLRIGLAILAVALPATADAPETQYRQFDQDAAEIEDLKTTLVWDRKRGINHADPGAAQIYCDTTVFPANNGRVPTVKELLTLVDEDPHKEYSSAFKPPYVQKNIDQLAFADNNSPVDKPYWTSTPGPNPGDWWTVDFKTGKTAIRTTSEGLYVRCVR